MSTARSRVGVLPAQTSILELSALWTLFTLTLRQFLHGRRMLVLGALALLPAALAVLIRSVDEEGPPLREIEFVCLFNLVPHVLLPLTALLYSSGMIMDEQENQTMTYLLIRPLPKWALYLTKLLATVCMVALLGLAFVVITYTAIYAGSNEFFDVFPLKMLRTFGVFTLSLLTYTAVFGCMSLLIQRSMVAGITYIAVVEGIMANLQFAVRNLTVMYYFRVLSLNWLNLDHGMSEGWAIKLSDAPEPFVCVLTLLTVSVLATFLATLVFSQREFHVKTPEAN
jgi:ABC-2 type transport system permease protein